MHLKMPSACRLLHIFANIIDYVNFEANSVDSDQTAPTRPV